MHGKFRDFRIVGDRIYSRDGDSATAVEIEHMDFMNIYVKPGDKFAAGDILAESNFCKDGKAGPLSTKIYDKLVAIQYGPG